MTTFDNVRIPDDDTLVRAATQALTRPDSYGTSDDNLFWTHGITIGTHRDDDLMGASNYARISEDMMAVFSDADVYVQYFSHWAVGYGESLIVRVLRDADDDITPDNITAAFAAITAIVTGLLDYPLYDDSDYSEREYEQSKEEFRASWGDLMRGWDVDEDGPEPTAAERRACWELGLYEETGWWDHAAFKDTIADMRRVDPEDAADHERWDGDGGCMYAAADASSDRSEDEPVTS